MELVASDIGGTHARFAIAHVEPGTCPTLDEIVTLKTAEYASYQTAWEAFAEHIGRDLPKAAAIAIASPISGEVLKMTNNPWIFRPSMIPSKLGVERYVLINDFGAVAHAVQNVAEEHLMHICGPEQPLPETGVISVIGPGTGLGVAFVVRDKDHYHVVETEGGHIEYPALDSTEDAILARLREHHTRVSVERVTSGPGLGEIYATLAAIEHKPVSEQTDRELWQAALAGTDSLAAAAFDRFCLSLGTAAGDIALCQGAKAVVIAGGLGARIADRLKSSGFAERFIAKGRFRGLMEKIPVKLISYDEPGLFGAAAAFAREHL